MTNPFKCPKCGLPANDVDGDPFAAELDDPLDVVRSMDVLCHCDGGHRWFEHADFSRQELEDERKTIIRRYTSSASEVS